MLVLNELLKRNLITELALRDVDLSIKEGKFRNFDEALVKYGVDNVTLTKIRSELLGLPIFNADIDINNPMQKYVAETEAREYRVLPLNDAGTNILGVVDPEESSNLDELQKILIQKNVDYKVKLITNDDYETGIQQFFDLGKSGELSRVNNLPNPSISTNSDGLVLTDVNSATRNIDKQTISDISSDKLNLKEIESEIQNYPIEKVINSILYEAIELEASDIHIEHLGEKIRARYRSDGILQTYLEMPTSMHQSLVARIKILCDMKLDEKRKPQDGRFSIKVDNHKIDFRVSTMPAYYGEKVVIRILDSYRGVRKLENIGFSPSHLELLRKSLERPYGMVIISGPTGSGKTTTLYSMLNEVDREKRNVVSLEDPIEYNIASMNQSQIFPEIGYTFATGLRSILRQDPDVIMVGEIRDAETAELAIQAALTGHLVFSTIHTNNSIGVITRLMDMGIDPYLIAPTIILSIAQRLVPQISPKCESRIEPTLAIKTMIDKQFEDLPENFKSELGLQDTFYEALPSRESPTGTKGRLPVLEILNVDDDIQKLILERKGEDEIYKVARSKGMITMKEDAMIKSMKGKVPFVEINGL
jgi:type II secretory ATPase GspE/PulE/Tfp pilus assembly ATPase PilB-like protein